MKLEPIVKELGSKYDVKPSEIAKSMDEAMKNPMFKDPKNVELRNIANEVDRYVNYLSFREPFKSKLGKGFQDMAYSIPGKYVLPFVKIPINLARVGANWSPLGAFKKLGWDRIFHKDWYSELTPNEKSDILGRSISGGIAITGIWGLMQSGLVEVTGQLSPNPDEKDLLYKQGYKPNSIYVKMSDGTMKGISYNHIPGLNVMCGLLGNWSDNIKYRSEKQDLKAEQESFIQSMSATLFGGAKTFLDNSVLTGVKNLLDQIEHKDPEGLDKAISNFIPNVRGGKRQLQKFADLIGVDLNWTDDNQYSTPELMDKILLKLDATSSLTRKYGNLGEPKESSLTVAFMPHTVDKSDPVYSYLLDNKIIPSTPKTLKVKGQDATPEQLSEYQKTGGERFGNILKNNLGKIKSYPKQYQEEIVKEIERKVHEETKSEIEYPAYKSNMNQVAKDIFTKYTPQYYKERDKKKEDIQTQKDKQQKPKITEYKKISLKKYKRAS